MPDFCNTLLSMSQSTNFLSVVEVLLFLTEIVI